MSVFVVMALLLSGAHHHQPRKLGRLVWVCQQDAQVVKPHDILWRHGVGYHIIERDKKGRPITLCGVVQRGHCGDGSAVGLVCDVK